MAQLDKLAISGIRSFGVNEPQLIRFCPLTLILGVNGAGKTTIIECLRYITSGEAPPGTDKGKTWIHDPLLTGSGCSVKAQVRLKFKEPDGHSNEITRSLELNTKYDKSGKQTLQFKTLDSILKRTDPDGKTHMLPSRCAEIDREMLSLIGVSRAVLTNVIFCHQEDNCWPLSEGKVLKEKFDKIFGSETYVKALSKIKTIRQAKVAEMKTLKAIKEKYEEIRSTKKEKQKNLKKLQDEHNIQKTKKTVQENKKKPIVEELAKIRSHEEVYTQIQKEISKITGQLQEKTRSETQLRKSMTEVLEGKTLDDIKEMMESLSSERETNDAKVRIKEIVGRVQAIDVEVRTKSSKKNALSIKVGSAQAREEQNKRETQLREKVITEVAQKLELETNDYQEIGDFLEAEIKQLNSKMDSETSGSQEEKKQQEELTSLRTELAKANHTIHLKQESQRKTEKEMKDVLDTVSKVEASATSVKDETGQLIQTIRNMKEKLLEGKIEDHVSNIDRSFYELNDEITSLKKLYSTLMRENVSSISEIKKEVKELEAQIAKKDDELTKSKKTRESVQKERRTKLTQLQGLLSKLDHACRSSDPSSQASSQQVSVANLQSEIKALQADLDNLAKEKEGLMLEKNNLEQDSSAHEVKMRNLRDNEHLLTLVEEKAELSAKLMDQEAKLGDKDCRNLFKKKDELNKKLEVVNNELGVITGGMRSTLDQIHRLEEDLKSVKYQSADEEYKKSVLNMAIQEAVCEDLNKYYTALDQAVIKYHQQKLEQINRLICHYWNITYQGEDIEGIEIVDDSTESTADKRRVYNYRVVMIKNGLQMDMRGRCSAGQKVLASIVIRIALSQIFCVNCPILTLDEPTTNLDSANIGALAAAISNIVQEQKGKMQLIIITHDEEFLKHLNEEFSEFYYRVEKRKGYSTIIRKNISDRE